MSPLYSHNVIQTALIGHPKLSQLSPDEIINTLNKVMTVQQGDDQFRVKLGYQKSNIKGVYYLLLCDICNRKCRKVYCKKILTNSEPKKFVLCGKCAQIRYKKKTRSENLAIKLLINPKLYEYYASQKLTSNTAILLLQVDYLKDRIEKEALEILYKTSSRNKPIILE